MRPHFVQKLWYFFILDRVLSVDFYFAVAVGCLRFFAIYAAEGMNAISVWASISAKGAGR